MEKLVDCLGGLPKHGASKIYLFISILSFATCALALTTNVPVDNVALALGSASSGFWFAAEATDRERLERFWNGEPREIEDDHPRFFRLAIQPLAAYSHLLAILTLVRLAYVV